MRTHGINRNRERGFFSIDNRLLKQQRLSAAGRFHLAVRPFCYEQIGIDGDRDAFQLARFFESGEETCKRAVSHCSGAAIDSAQLRGEK